VNADRVAVYVAQGVSPVCAVCLRFWRGREFGLPGTRCTAVDDCGGPIKGDTFHEYEGPMSEGRFSDWCFVCARESKYGILVSGRERIVGVCEEHVEYLRSMQPVHRDTPNVPVVLKDGQRLVTVVQLLGPRRQTLWERIAETEKELAAS